MTSDNAPSTMASLSNTLDTRPFLNLLETDKKGNVPIQGLLDYLAQAGILPDDPRVVSAIQSLGTQAQRRKLALNPTELEHVVSQSAIIKNVLTKKLVIPDFEEFTEDISAIFSDIMPMEGGKVADYIPQLARVNPAHFALSICTIDGQRISLGDTGTQFCLQSTCKPVNYCLAIEALGEDKVHQHVGREPSGVSFNELALNRQGLPHNPMINSGAIMTTSLIKQGLDMADRYDHVVKTWSRLCGDRPVNFNNSVYLSERQTADRNFALAYFMRENNAFPEGINLIDNLELYFQCCSMESCTHDLSVAAATFANGGVNPLTGEQVFQAQTVQHCMSLMLTCGMYDFSGEFAFRIGLPAKSGVSGAMMVIVPNVMGISIWSPRLDHHGNSVRGVAFCEKLVQHYNFHHYDSLIHETTKKNPRLGKYETRVNQIINLIWAASNGDLNELIRLHAEGLDINMADYDGRTALHLAASENQLEIIHYLLAHNAQLDPKDRWGGTPLSDAETSGHQAAAELLRQAMQQSTATMTNGKAKSDGEES